MKQDLSIFDSIFCDSIEALKWAYKNGLSRKATVHTSSPFILFEDGINSVHIESSWGIEKMKKFQTSISKFSEDIYDAAISIDNCSHAKALCIAHESVLFHRLLFKAACIKESDLTSPRLFLSVDGSGGPHGNNMNPPWDQLLSENKFFINKVFKLKDKVDNVASHKISLLSRLRFAGLETLIYRILTTMSNKYTQSFFKKSVIIPSENELLIEIAYHLGIKGVRLEEFNTNINGVNENKYSHNMAEIKSILSPKARSRIEEYVIPSLVDRCEDIFFKNIDKSLITLQCWSVAWSRSLLKIKKDNTILLTNSPVNVKLLALSNICKENNIPVVSVQHGIAKEISETHTEVSTSYEINASDIFIAYNHQSGDASEKSHFSKGKAFVSGISKRHLRMKNIGNSRKITIPIVYISTNLYKGNLGMFTTWLTDYDRAKKEQKIVSCVLSKIPHRVRYKTYPEDNKRYPDPDPILKYVGIYDNIDLFDEKIDMRYLLRQHRIIITSKATSTIGWPVMSRKPVIFINDPCNNQLNVKALELFSKGLFLFDSSDINFYDNLLNFLSQSIEDIELLWKEKEVYRNQMIKKYFSSYELNSGSRAANMIVEKLL